MTRATIGVIGHVDHGKTALVAALTGTDTDRLREEKERGISIALGFAHLDDGTGTVADLIDMPGHERFVRTMIAGASGIDAVLLAVAADEGVREQTVEHADIAALLGITHAVVAVTRSDLVPARQAEAVAEDAVELLEQRGIAASGWFVTSSVSGEGLGELQTALLDLARNAPARRNDGNAWLPIDRVFSIPGHGPVVTGTLRGNALAEGDSLELVPSRRAVRVRALQVHGAAVDAAHPGERTAVNLRDVSLGDVARGMALAAPGGFATGEWLTIALRTVADAPPLANGMLLRLLAGTAETDARLRLLDRDEIGPGEQRFAQLRLAAPLAIPAGEHAILRVASPARTVAGGRILDPAARRRRRFDGALLLRLADLRDLPPAEFVASDVVRHGLDGVSRAELARLTAFSLARLDEILSHLPVTTTKRGTVFLDAGIATIAARIPVLLAPHPAGLSRNQILSSLPGTRAALVDEALARLAARKSLARRGGQWLVPQPDEDAARAADEDALAAQIAALMQDSGLTPPNPAALISDHLAKRAVDRLLRDGTLVRTADRSKKKEMLFHRDAIADAQARLAQALAGDDGLLVTEICAVLGISRKFAMPLLDHLDGVRFTRRVDDRRVLFQPDRQQI